MAEKLTVPIMKKRLDSLLKVVRYFGTDDGKANQCATCAHQNICPIAELQCGHFIKRGNLVLKYDTTNLMPQCRRCNHFLDGAQDKAALYILDTYGEPVLRHLIETDKKWLRGEISMPKRPFYVENYNKWLRANREVEEMWKIKLIPKTWEATE